MASGTADLQRDLGGAIMQSIFGDAVHFDMHDEAANSVFRDLRGLGLDRGGAIRPRSCTAPGRFRTSIRPTSIRSSWPSWPGW